MTHLSDKYPNSIDPNMTPTISIESAVLLYQDLPHTKSNCAKIHVNNIQISNFDEISSIAITSTTAEYICDLSYTQ